jgi:phosphotriesterase-related protein
MVQTVLGEVPAAELGFTYMHEHVLACTPGLYTSYPQLYDRQAALERGTAAAIAAKEKGVRTVVDMTPSDFHRDPELVAEIASASGVNFIHATGAYWYTTIFFRSRDIETVSDLFIHDINVGMNGTGIRAGILKAATGADGMTPENEKCLRAIARAQLATGVPISTHADMGAHAGLAQVALFKEAGVDMANVVIGHCGDRDDVPYLEQLIDEGVVIGLDRFGLETQWPDEQRIDLLETMLRKGYASRMVVSHDTCAYGDFGPPAFFSQPRWHWSNIVENVLPELRRRGVPESDITAITVETPRRVFGG